MNEAIYCGKGKAVVYLKEETLTDGSKVHDIEFSEGVLHCRDEKRAREAMAIIAAALREAGSCDNVLHL